MNDNNRAFTRASRPETYSPVIQAIRNQFTMGQQAGYAAIAYYVHWSDRHRIELMKEPIMANFISKDFSLDHPEHRFALCLDLMRDFDLQLQSHGIDPATADWDVLRKKQVNTIEPPDLSEYFKSLRDRSKPVNTITL